MRTVRFATMTALALTGGLLFAGTAQASIVLDFDSDVTVQSAFDSDGVGDSAGSFLDGDTGLSVTFTTRSILGDTEVNTGSNGLGVGSDKFTNSGDLWAFDADQTLEFELIDVGAVDAAEELEFGSDAWIGITFTPTISDLTYSSLTGRFTYSDDNGDASGDRITLAHLNGGSPITLNPGDDFVIELTVNSGNDWGLEELQFAVVNPIPEPTSLALLGLGSIMIVSRQRQRQC